MALLDIFRRKEKRGLDNPDAFVVSPYSNLGLTFGDLMRQRTAMSLSAVYRCVELISDSVAMLPIRIKHGNEVLANHSLYQVIADRNNLTTKYNFIKLLIQSVLLRGNGFAYIERNPDGSVKALRFLEAGDVTIVYDKQRGALYYHAPIVSGKRIEPCNMIHLVKNSYDGVNGISVISYADGTLQLAKASEASAFNWYNKGGNLSGIVTVQSPLTSQQRKDIIDNWNTAYSGGGQGIAVLQGNMNYQPVQVNAKDAQLIETRQFNSRDIARFFGVAPSMLGDNTGASYGSVEAEQQAFILHTLMPYIAMIENEFSRKLLKGSESDFRIDLDENYLLRADKAATAAYYSAMVNNGIISRNEARRELGFDPVDGGDELTVAFSKVSDNKVSATDSELSQD